MTLVSVTTKLHPLRFFIKMNKPDCTGSKITHRNFRGINIKEFMEDLQSSQHLSKCEGSVDELIEDDNKGLKNINNHYFPSC